MPFALSRTLRRANSIPARRLRQTYIAARFACCNATSRWQSVAPMRSRRRRLVGAGLEQPLDLAPSGRASRRVWSRRGPRPSRAPCTTSASRPLADSMMILMCRHSGALADASGRPRSRSPAASSRRAARDPERRARRARAPRRRPRAMCTSWPRCCSRNSIAATMFGSSSAIRIFLLIGGSRRRALTRRRACRRAVGTVNEKHAPRPSSLSTQSLPPKCSMIWRLMCKPEPAAVRLVGERVADLVELAEDLLLVLRADARGRCRARRPAGCRSRSASAISTRPFARVAELRRVRQQVQHHLDHAVEVGGHRRDLVRQARRRPRCSSP